jgi:outer membrane protein OmpA-like peptidoglycan-associated protein
LLGIGISISTQEPASAAACGSGSSSATYSGGDGVSSSTAFRITTAADLIRLSATSADWTGKFFIQTADIDLGGCEWTPIGIGGVGSTQFTGQYDGGFFAISGLNVVTSAGNPSTAGFFGLATGAAFKNIKIIGATVAITTPAEVGILVGRAQSVSIDNVVTSGTITNTDASTSYTGGIAGLIRKDTTTSTIVNSYSSATVSSSSNDAGGFVGRLSEATLSNSYARGAVTGAGGLGGLSGSNYDGTFTNAFYDEQTSTQPANGLGTAKTTAEMKSLSTFVAWPIVDGWAAHAPNDTPAKIWGICSAVNDGYPFLLWEYATDPCTVAPPSNSGSGSSSGSAYVAPVVVPEVIPSTVRQITIRQATDDKPARLLGRSLNKDVLFVADSTRLSPEARKSLRQAARLAKASDGKVAVTGFAAMTNRGRAYEKSVALKRARVVARFLRAQGFDDWIYFHGLSGRQGQAFEGDPRRVEIRILN